MRDLDKDVRDRIFTSSELDFESLAMDIFSYQYNQNLTYQRYCQTLTGRKVLRPESLLDIPYLPISLYKTHIIQSGEWIPEQLFQSSSTGGVTSVHAVRDIQVYRNSFMKCFQLFYGEIEHCAIMGLLPSYLERQGSSLIKMVSELIECSSDEDSGFFLFNYSELSEILMNREIENKRTVLFGVTFALLDFADNFNLHLPNTIIIETGGMKGRGKEPTREEIHQRLKNKLGVLEVHSEYGMTEMFSQAYMTNGVDFSCPSWLKPLVRDRNDPLTTRTQGRGALNFIDLANIDTCSFIATDDLGEVFTGNRFSVFGRTDNSELRGCNLMVVDFF